MFSSDKRNKLFNDKDYFVMKSKAVNSQRSEKERWLVTLCLWRCFWISGDISGTKRATGDSWCKTTGFYSALDFLISAWVTPRSWGLEGPLTLSKFVEIHSHYYGLIPPLTVTFLVDNFSSLYS